MVIPPKPLTIASFGGKGTGKTAGVRQRINKAKPARLAVFDCKSDPNMTDLGTAYTWAQRADLARAMMGRRFCVRLLGDYASDTPLEAQFDWFCDVCWHAGNLWMWVDELPEVTKANKAPKAWRRCVNVGRDYALHDGTRSGITILATGQRMAECDKSIISNADVIRTGRLAHLEDARLMAKTLGVRPEEVTSLPDLHYIEWRANASGLERGVLSFGNAKPPQAAKKPPPRRAGK